MGTVINGYILFYLYFFTFLHHVVSCVVSDVFNKNGIHVLLFSATVMPLKFQQEKPFGDPRGMGCDTLSTGK
jgi:hypothetical protein